MKKVNNPFDNSSDPLEPKHSSEFHKLLKHLDSLVFHHMMDKVFVKTGRRKLKRQDVWKVKKTFEKKQKCFSKQIIILGEYCCTGSFFAYCARYWCRYCIRKEAWIGSLTYFQIPFLSKHRIRDNLWVQTGSLWWLRR